MGGGTHIGQRDDNPAVQLPGMQLFARGHSHKNYIGHRRHNTNDVEVQHDADWQTDFAELCLISLPVVRMAQKGVVPMRQ